MRIINCAADSHLPCTRQYTPLGASLPADIAVEHWMEVFINERPAMRLTCTPEHLDELVTGRLLTEGLIAQAEDIQEIYICEKGLRAKVLLNEAAAARLSRRDTETVSTCCTDNKILLAGELSGAARVTPLSWDPLKLRTAAESLKKNQPLYSATHALHACCLVMGDRLLCCREDIGRHNALDKAIGYALLSAVDLSECMLFTTGRLPDDMVSKAARAGVPLLASKTYPTDRGVALARQSGLTLVTLRPDGAMLIWANGQDQFDEGNI